MISVVIPTKNAGPQFQQTLAGIAAQEIADEVEIIVVDSGSTDQTCELARVAGARVIEIPPEEFNHGATRNLAVQRSRGELVVLTVQDAIPYDAHWMSALAEAIRADDQTAGAYSRHLPHDDANLFVKNSVNRGVLGRTDRVVQFAGMLGPEQRDTGQRYRCYAFNNVSSMMRRSVWEDFPLDEISFAEDLEWSKRVIDAGYKIVYEPRSMVCHSHQRGWREALRRAYVTQIALNTILDGTPRQVTPRIAMRDFWNICRNSAKLARPNDAQGLREGLATAQYAFAEQVSRYVGMTLGDRADLLKQRYWWFDAVDRGLARGL